jgi:uracil phosphoribosyltransferase
MEKLIAQIKDEKEKAELRYSKFHKLGDSQTMFVNDGMIIAFSEVLNMIEKILSKNAPCR